VIDAKRVGWGCTSCATRYVLRLVRCPRCHGRDFTRAAVVIPPAPVIAAEAGARPGKRSKPVEEFSA
jgi:hypothetical protein